MRTTLIIDDELVRKAKVAAARSGLTLSEVVNRALREALSLATEAPEQPFRFVTFGLGEPRVQHGPEELRRFETGDE